MADEAFMEEFRRRTGIANRGGPTLDTNVVVADIPEAQAPTNQIQPSIADALRQHIGASVNTPPSEVTASPSLNFTQRYGRPDAEGGMIPIDISSGMPDRPGQADYFRISQQSDPESKAAALQQMYPDRNVRILDTGDVTLEVIDSATGKPKDVVINPSGIDAADLMDLLSQAPEIAASIATAVATSGRGALKTAAQIVLSAFAGGFTGAARDVASRTAEGIPLRGEDIFQERGVQTMFDIGGEGAMGAIGKATRILSPFAREIKPGTLAFNAQKGAEFMKDNYGVDYALTPGVRTGSQALLAVEAAEGPLPGSRGVVGRMREANEKVIQDVQALATGKVTPEDEVGRLAIGQLSNRVVEPLENAFNRAREFARQKGDRHIMHILDQAIGVPRGVTELTKSEAGDITASAFQRRVIRGEEAVAKAYQMVNDLPGGSGDVLSGGPAASAAAEIRREIPAVIKEVEKDSGLLDELGRPITMTVEERQMLKSGIPEGLEKALSDLENLKGGKVSLQTLTNLKKAAFDAIAAFKTAHGDAKDRWFTKIAGAYEKGIQEGVDATNDPQLKAALTNAREVYKKEIVPLERPGLKEFAKGEMDTGMLSPQQVFERMFEGPRAVMNYNRLKESLGENSVAFRALKRGWLDSKINEASRDTILGTVDPAKLADAIKDTQDKPELARELFGKNYQDIQNALRIRSETEKIGSSSFKLEENDVQALLSMKDPTVADFRNLMTMAKNRDQVYINGVFKDIKDGIADFQPTKVVAKLRNTDTPASTVEEVLKGLTVPQRQALATAEFYRLLSEASIREGKTASRAIGGETLNLSPSRLAQAVGTGDQRARTLMLLGDDLPAPGAPPPKPGQVGANRFEVLKNLVDALAPGEAASTAFGSLGSLRQGQQIAELTKGPLKYAGGFVKNMILATAYMGNFGKLVTNRQFDAQASAIAANTMIASEPFLRAAIETFGDENAKEMVADAKQSIDRWVMQRFRGGGSPEEREREQTARMMQGQPSGMNVR